MPTGVVLRMASNFSERKREARDGFAADGASEFASFLFAAGADRDLSAGASECDGSGASGASGAEE